MKFESIAECSPWSILQYFRPSLSYQLLLSSLFCLFLSGSFTQVLLYFGKQRRLLLQVSSRSNILNSVFKFINSRLTHRKHALFILLGQETAFQPKMKKHKA